MSTDTETLNECPACGSPLRKHGLESEEDFEFWAFSCRAVVSREPGGKFENDNDCGEINPLDDALALLNAAIRKGSRQDNED